MKDRNKTATTGIPCLYSLSAKTQFIYYHFILGLLVNISILLLLDILAYQKAFHKRRSKHNFSIGAKLHCLIKRGVTNLHISSKICSTGIVLQITSMTLLLANYINNDNMSGTV